MSEKEWETYLAEYEKLYEEHIRNKERDIPNLIKLLERFDDEIYAVTDIYKLMIEVKGKIEKDLKLNREQEILFEYWRVCESNLTSDTVEYAFIYGYSLAMGLKEECKKVQHN